MIRRLALVLPLAAVAAPAPAEERRYMLSGFDRIRVDGPFEVVVTAGASSGAVAVGDARALETVNVRVQGTTLIVSPNVSAWGGYPGAVRSRPRVAVRVPALRSAAVIGGGQVTIDRMRGQRVDLTLTGAGTLAVGDAQADRVDATLIGTGSVTIAGRALQGRFQSNGAGTIDAGGFEVADLTVTWQSAGDGRFAARNTAQVNAAGSGSVRVAGTPACTVRGYGPVVCGAQR